MTEQQFLKRWLMHYIHPEYFYIPLTGEQPPTPPPPPITEAWVRFVVGNPGSHRIDNGYAYDSSYDVRFYVQNTTNNKFFQAGSYTEREQDPETGQYTVYYGNNAERDYSRFSPGQVVTEYPQYSAVYLYPDYEYYNPYNTSIIWYKFPAGTYRITEYSSSGNLVSSTTFAVNGSTVQDGKMTVTLTGHFCPLLSIDYNQVQLVVNEAEITTEETEYPEYYSWDIGPASTRSSYTPAPSEENANTDLGTLGSVFNGSYMVASYDDGGCPLNGYEEIFVAIQPTVITNTTGLTCSIDTEFVPYDSPQSPQRFGDVKSYDVSIEETVHFTPANAYWRDHWYLGGHYVEKYTSYYYAYEYRTYGLYLNGTFLRDVVIDERGSYAQTRTLFPQCNHYENYGFFYASASDPPPEFDDPDEIDYFVKAAWTGYNGSGDPYVLYYWISPWAEQWGGHEYTYAFDSATKIFTLTTITANEEPVTTTYEMGSNWEYVSLNAHGDITDTLRNSASASGDIQYSAGYKFTETSGIGESWFSCGLKNYLTYIVP